MVRRTITQSDLAEVNRTAETLRAMLLDLAHEIAQGATEEPGPLTVNLGAFDTRRLDYVVPRWFLQSEGVPVKSRAYGRLAAKLLDPEPGRVLIASLPLKQRERTRRMLRRCYRSAYWSMVADIAKDLRRVSQERREIAARCINDADVAGQFQDALRGIYHIARLRVAGTLLWVGGFDAARSLAASSLALIEARCQPPTQA